MTASDARPDIERALLDPAAVFATPEEVRDHRALSREQKIEILQRWEYDAADISVAVEEGMPGAEETLLRRITLALQAIAGPLDLDRTGASKHHGLSRGAVPRKG
ncbi:hypothetical protein [Neoroseomonas oryzicola]|uniref:Uncharacterized protein n=1 Tax=Neoroseomonas oryzicola TaxID=535904 RepID=A0A9X9WNQ4_9PROT|nr:hypothetical protein [Neoroseomonas oryzicola]MBR0661964.1 hypothetical protein [Neoroseomonas oryzicola]NKE16096.1 hypothetical protein [Neoroseomonas oryzicola]